MKNTFMILSCFVLLFSTSCKEEVKKHEEERKFLATSPIAMDTIITQDYVAQIQSINHIELRAQEKGYLQKIFVDEGQMVKKGQLLFQIMPNIYEAEVAMAKAEVKFVEIEYNNTKKLAESNVVAPNELAMAEAKLEKAKAEMELAKVHLQFTEIRAPFDGIIDRFHVRVGSLIDEGELLSTLSDNSKMWVYYNVPEAEYLDYKTKEVSKTKAIVKLKMANNKYFDYSGEVGTIEADFNNETGNIPFRATFPNPKGLLRHGETGNIEMSIPYKDALLIPQKATFEILDKNYVFVIDEEHKITTREIVIASELQHIFIVKSGLSPTDKILLDGLRLVKEGDEIEFEMKDPKEVIAHLDLYAE